MEVTKECLEARLVSLREQHARLQADVYAVEGAMQVVEQLIAYTQEPAAPQSPS